MAKVKEPEARAAYLALGPARTLAELHKHYTRTAPKAAPSIDSLKQWSRKKGWQALAKQHDEQVTKAAVEKVVKQQVKNAAELVSHLITAASEGLTRAVAIAGQEVKFKDLVDGSVTALKAAEVLAGGVSDRIEQHQRVKYERAAEVKKEMEDIFGPSAEPAAKPGSSGPVVH